MEREEAEKKRKFEGDLKDFPLLPVCLEDLLLGKDPNIVKNVASGIMQWMKPVDEKSGKKVNLGKGTFLGWEVGVDKKDLVISERLGLLKKVTSSVVSPATFINWVDMAGMPSLGNGNTKGLKKEAGLTVWIGFIRFLVEWSFRVLGLNPDEWVNEGAKVGVKKLDKEKKPVGTKKTKTSNGSAKKENVVQLMARKGYTAYDSDEDFLPEKKKTFVKPVATKKRTGSEENATKAKEAARKRIKQAKQKKNDGGVDESLHLGIALSVSEEQEKQRRKQEEEQKRKKHEQRKLAADKKEIRDRLVAFKQSNKTEYKFQPHLSSFQRRLVHEIAKDLGLKSESNGEGSKRRVEVRKVELEQEMKEQQAMKEIVTQVLNFSWHFKVNSCIDMGCAYIDSDQISIFSQCQVDHEIELTPSERIHKVEVIYSQV